MKKLILLSFLLFLITIIYANYIYFKIETNLNKDHQIKTQSHNFIPYIQYPNLSNEYVASFNDYLSSNAVKRFLKFVSINKYFLIIFVFFILLAILSFNQIRSQNSTNKALAKINKELSLAYQRLEEISRTDPLTRLSNRRDMIAKLEQEKIRFGRSENPFVIIMCDIDDFKQINDNYGHDAGDFVLKTLSELMKSFIREQDVIARWGGEEFLLMLPETNLEGGRRLSEKLRRKIITSPFIFDDNIDFPITLTFGISVYNKPMSIDKCIAMADRALYKGKQGGKNCIVLAN